MKNNLPTYKCVRYGKEFYDFENLWSHECNKEVQSKVFVPELDIDTSLPAKEFERRYGIKKRCYKP